MNATNDQTINAYEHHVQEYIDNSPPEVSGAIKPWIDSGLVGLPKDAKIFEIGSGFGRDAIYIQSKGYEVELTDATRAFVKHLLELGFKAKVFNALKDEFNGLYDLIFADAVLLRFTSDEVRGVIDKVFKALNHDGRFLFSLKQGDGEELTTQKLGATRYFNYWQEDEISKVLHAVGFQNIAITHTDDYRKGKPSWLLISATKGSSSADLEADVEEKK